MGCHGAVGETFEQYEVFQQFAAQREGHFDKFVARHGCASAQAGFAAIDAALEAHGGALLRRLADASMATRDPRFPPNATMGVGPTWQYLAEASEWEQRGRRPR